VGEIVRFRVETEEWHDQIPNAPDLGEEITERKPAYSIYVGSYSGALSPLTPADITFYSGLDADPRSGTYHLVVRCCF
jgi:hypothetical protein